MRNVLSATGRRRSRRSPRAAWPNRGLAVALVAAGALLGWWLPHLERSRDLGGLSYDASAAEATLGAIASGIITLTGFVLTAVTLVVQSVQSMSSRLAGVLGFFERSLVLFGALTGTAVYALVVLAQVREHHVPDLAVTLAIVFVVLSTGTILRTLAGLREMITGGGLVRAVGDQLHESLDHVWQDAAPAEASAEPSTAPSAGPEPDGVVVTATAGGIVQSIDGPAIAAAAAGIGLHVTCLTAVGSFVEPGEPFLRVSPGPPAGSDARRIVRAVRLGPSRLIGDDPAYGLRLLVDVAIRALSPAVNDPTTAVQSLDQIEAALLRLAARPLGPVTLRDRDGAARVTIPRPGWSQLLDLALVEIIAYGAGSLQVQRRLRALLDTVERTIPPARTATLTPYRAMLDRAARELPDPALAGIAASADPQGLGGPRATSR